MQTFRTRQRLCKPHRLISIDVGQHHDEFFPAQAGAEVAATVHFTLEQRAHSSQDGVPRRMPMLVVHALEVVDIHKNQR